MSDDIVLFRGHGDLKIGDVFRYRIEYTPLPASKRKSLWLYVYNTELSPLRAAYLNGPFTLYVDMRPEKYDDNRQVLTPADQPHYDHNLRAGAHFKCELCLTGPHKHVWYVDIVGEQLFNKRAVVKHQLILGTSKHAAKSSKEVAVDPECEAFGVNVKDTRDLWLEPVQPLVEAAADSSNSTSNDLSVPRAAQRAPPMHLVILTHGLMSNVTADMLYLKEEIDKQAKRTGEYVICKGFTGNVCKTEKGVKYLGRGLADWLMFDIIPRYKPEKISFIAHSLGGLIQTYALGYIETVHPGFFDSMELVNFVCLASPLLGISSENPGYVKMVLDFGFVGKTGRDLGLSWQIGKKKPLLMTLPTGPVNKILQRFENRTCYANAVNDGIVPLRTASLLYLDWRAIVKATAAKRGSNAANYDAKDSEEREHPDQSEVTSLDGFGDTGQSHADNQKHHSHLLHHHHEDTLKRHHEKHFQGGSTGSTHTVNSITNAMDEVFNWLNPWAPHRVSKKKLRRYQTMDEDMAQNTDGEGDDHVELPKKTSIIESGMALMIAPLPNDEFIGHPDKREDVIFHDRIYTSEDLPPRRFKTKTFFGEASQDDPKEIARNEERMARAWHRDKSWRKVLVQLLPEAHNNVIVRRRFTNAYGWPVVHHLVMNHFGESKPAPDGDGSDVSIATMEEKIDLTPVPSHDLSVPGKASHTQTSQVASETMAPSTSDGSRDGVDATWFEPSKSDSEQSSVHDGYM